MTFTFGSTLTTRGAKLKPARAKLAALSWVFIVTETTRKVQFRSGIHNNGETTAQMLQGLVPAGWMRRKQQEERTAATLLGRGGRRYLGDRSGLVAGDVVFSHADLSIYLLDSSLSLRRDSLYYYYSLLSLHLFSFLFIVIIILTWSFSIVVLLVAVNKWGEIELINFIFLCDLHIAPRKNRRTQIDEFQSQLPRALGLGFQSCNFSLFFFPFLQVGIFIGST